MDHHSAAVPHRPASEIMAEARLVQARHAASVFGAAVRWIRDTAKRLGGEPGKLDDRHLTVH